jgi:hypothetical protein
MPSVLILALLLPRIGLADTATPSSPLDAWASPPGEGALAGEPQGLAAISPDRFEVQSEVTVDWIYTVGADGMGPGDGIRVEDPLLHGMRWSKYGASVLDPSLCTPLTTALRQASYGLVTGSTTGSASLGIERNTEESELHDYGYTDLWIEDGRLEPGDQLTLRFGDTRRSEDCAHQAPDRAFTEVPWRGFEYGAHGFVELGPSPVFSLDPVPEPAMLWVAAPSILGPDEPLELHVALLDRLGNPIPDTGLDVSVDQAYGGAVVPLDDGNPGWLLLSLDNPGPGVHRVALDAGDLSAVSNPVVVLEDEPDQRLYWGDLHTHHGHTRVLADGSRVDENHAYARDVLGWDFGCESMKLPPVELGAEALWTDLQRACQADTEQGRYLALLGFEWMGDSRGHGHHNVYFDDCTGILPSHQQITGLDDASGLLALVAAGEQELGHRAAVIPHASAFTGFQWRTYDAQHRVAAEVYSGWGNSLEADGRGSAEMAIALDHAMGFIAASDNHDGWMGNPLTRLGTPGGIAAFQAPALTRADIFDALQARRSYATTGARIILEVQAELNSGPVPAGAVLVSDGPHLSWTAHGTDTIRSLEIRGVAPGEHAEVHTLHSEAPGTLDHEGSFMIEGWKGRTWALWLRVEQHDGQVAWSSPTWFTAVCSREGATDPDGLCLDDSGQPGDGGCSGCRAVGGAPLAGLFVSFLLTLRRRRDCEGSTWRL